MKKISSSVLTFKLRLSSIVRTYLLKVNSSDDRLSRMRLADVEPLAKTRLFTLTGQSVAPINDNKLSEYVSDGDKIDFETDPLDIIGIKNDIMEQGKKISLLINEIAGVKAENGRLSDENVELKNYVKKTKNRENY